MHTREEIFCKFRTPRYDRLNQCRWDHFLSMGIPLEGKTVLELGAGVGDQTEWLLKQGIKHIHVNEGRQGNIDVIREQFGHDPRVTIAIGNIEQGLPDLDIFVDVIYFYGVYYHLDERVPHFPILQALARLGQTIAFDFHAGDNRTDLYRPMDDPSSSISLCGLRVRVETLIQGMKETWGLAYLPKKQLEWNDPGNPNEVRLVAVASHAALDSPGLVLQP